jgi:hypothetical protein
VKSTDVLLILLALSLVPQAWATTTVTVPNPELVFDFDKPKGPGVTFEKELVVRIYNNDPDNSITITDFSANVSGLLGVEVAVTDTSFVIGNGSSTTTKLVLTVPASTEEGRYPVSIDFGGTGVSPVTKNVTLEINHPPATLEVTWDSTDWGNLEAGSSFTRTLKVLEVMGYRDAEDVSLFISAQGPITVEYSGDVDNVSASSLKSIEVAVTVPERGLVPGDYHVTPHLAAGGAAKITTYNATYTIPQPVMKLESDFLDFGQITFETDKDYSQRSLVIMETGGFTPIEDLTITLESGEEGWVTYTSKDYIPPGGREEIPFVVYLPQDASLGKREWIYLIDTPYAGSDEFEARVQVYFPGIDDAVSYLEGREPIKGYPETQTLIHETLELLRVGRDKTEIKKIAMVMSIYGGTRSFLNILEEATTSMETGDHSRAGDLLISAYDSINKIKIGNTNIYDADLKLYSSSIETLAQETWKTGAEDALKLLEEKALEYEETNYKSAALYYKRISRLYSLLGHPDSAEEYERKRLDLERRYTQSLEEASALQIEADSKVRQANALMFAFQDVLLVLNPFYYEEVSALYSDAIEGYARAGEKYRVAGEDREAAAKEDHARELAEKKEEIYLLFVAYGLFWTVLFVGLVARISLGLQRFRQDELDGLIGDVAVRKGKLEEAEA